MAPTATFSTRTGRSHASRGPVIVGAVRARRLLAGKSGDGSVVIGPAADSLLCRERLAIGEPRAELDARSVRLWIDIGSVKFALRRGHDHDFRAGQPIAERSAPGACVQVGGPHRSARSPIPPARARPFQ